MESNTNSTAQALKTIGIDIGKEVFHILLGTGTSK